jgi:hypothetical protein
MQAFIKPPTLSNPMESSVLHALGHEKKYMPYWRFNPRLPNGERVLESASTPQRIHQILKETGKQFRGQVVFRGHPNPETIPVPFHRFIHDNHCWIEYANLDELQTLFRNCETLLDTYLVKVVIYDVGFYIK